MEKLNPKKVSLSLAATSGIVSAACALLIAVAPQFTVNLFGAVFHGIDLSKIQKTMTVSGTILGTVEVIILALITGWLFAKIYNSFK
ncbi:hypothetical protein J4442_03165 [Candidatus Woesearchaeota archaeon]|nr:hypothetical protein [Candidatus Woesearchaeota archaeon]